MFGRNRKKEKSIDSRLGAISSAKPIEFDRSMPTRKGRESERQTSYKIGVITLYDNDELRCVVQNVSQTGARLVLEGSITLPGEFLVEIQGFKATTRAKRVWQRDNKVGVQFI